MSEPTLLGRVGAVAGGTINVRQAESLASGIAVIGGRTYRVGQVGSFVRIPQGYHNLYGIISDVGATASPETIANTSARGDRWMKVQLVGEIVDTTFERGISQYPAINDLVHLVTEDDLAKIYGTAESGQVVIGRLAGAESIPVHVDLDRLVTRHSAVLGSTGSGKSTTVSSLLRSLAGLTEGTSAFPSARILLLDLHGEYAQAFGDAAKIFRINPGQGEHPLFVPYWAIDIDELLTFVLGKTEEKALTAIQEKILAAKVAVSAEGAYPGVDPASLTANSPLPFSLKQLWADLVDPEYKTWKDNTQTQTAIINEGDAESLTAPEYPLPALAGGSPFINKLNVLSIRKQLSQLRSRLLDRQYDFMLRPGDWTPNLSGVPNKDLPELLSEWLGHDRPITILDLSGVPSAVLNRLVGGILNIIYEALFWGRELPEGGRSRPQLVVMEEAHRYLGRDADNPARELVQRIVKEGRKFGVGAMIVSQRPSEIDETILSQCGTFFSMRLSNSADRAKVQAALPDSLSGIVDSLPVLRTGEAIITGEAAKLPIRCRVTLPPEDSRPASGDPPVAIAWSNANPGTDYSRLVSAWRSQDPKWKPEENT